MSTLYKALGALLTYPTGELVGALPEIETIVADAALSPDCRKGLQRLIAELAGTDLIDAQERYVDLFDRGRRTALHLFEHVHGDSRERGQAMVDLKAVYAAAGFALATHELPDYLPAVLEFAALKPELAQEILGDCAHIVRTIGAALAARQSVYAAVPRAVLESIGEAGFQGAEAPAAVEEKSLDDEWQEQQVSFGPGEACRPASQPAVSVVQFMPRAAA